MNYRLDSNGINDENVFQISHLHSEKWSENKELNFSFIFNKGEWKINVVILCGYFKSSTELKCLVRVVFSTL